MHDQIVANKRRAALLSAAFVAVVAVLLGVPSLLLLGMLGLVGALLAAVAVTAVAHLGSPALALALVRARPADPVEHGRLHNVVEGLCFSSGVPKPGVFVSDDDGLNALAVGRSPRHSALVVTTGLLGELSRVELEAVLAHELSHVKSYDVLVSTLAVSMVALPAWFLPDTNRSRLVTAVVGDRREPMADLTGVSLTRYPPALISAFEKLRHGGVDAPPGARATEHLWIRPVGPIAALAPLDERIEALREL